MKRRGHLRVVEVEAKRPTGPAIVVVGDARPMSPALAAKIRELIARGLTMGRG